MEEEAPSRGARADGVGEAHKVDVVLLESAHEIDELLDTPTEPVELPDDERAALPQNAERLLESGSR